MMMVVMVMPNDDSDTTTDRVDPLTTDRLRNIEDNLSVAQLPGSYNAGWTAAYARDVGCLLTELLRLQNILASVPTHHLPDTFWSDMAALYEDEVTG